MVLSNELSAFKFTSKELESKLENMGLMIEVHHKMHEIIIEASDKETKRSKKEAQYSKRLEEMEEVMVRITDARSFLEQCGVIEDRRRKMEVAKKQLMKLLF